MREKIHVFVIIAICYTLPAKFFTAIFSRLCIENDIILRLTETSLRKKKVKASCAQYEAKSECRSHRRENRKKSDLDAQFETKKIKVKESLQKKIKKISLRYRVQSEK